MANDEWVINKNILIAVDESENARRAVYYVAQLLGGIKGFNVNILHVIPEPEEDFFPRPEDKDKWIDQYKQKVDTMLAGYRQILVRGGFAQEDVTVRSTLRYCPSIAGCILAEHDETQHSTVVVGRHGLSRSEEFLFGSISSKVVTHAKNCTIWVVE